MAEPGSAQPAVKTSRDRFATGYRLVNNEIIATAVLDEFSRLDWRFLFWLSRRAAAGAEPAELLEILWDNNSDHAGATPPHRLKAPDRRHDLLSPAAYRMALDVIERTMAIRRAPANASAGVFVTIGEAAALRGVSRQAITHLITTNRVDFVRNRRTVLIRRGSIDALPSHPRKRAAGQQILVYDRPALARLRAGDGIIHAMPRTVVAQAGIRPGFGYTVLHARARLNQRDMDELARAGIDLKGHEAFREWLGANARHGDAEPARTPPLAVILRAGGVWRLNLAASEVEQPVMARIFGHPDLARTSCAVLHGVMMGDSGYLDVKLRDDADERAVASFVAIARAHCRWVRDAAEILARENPATTWCEDMRDQFAAALRRAIAGLDPPEAASGSALLEPDLFRVLLTIVEAGYTEFQGYAEPEYWIDFRAALRVRDAGADPAPPLAAKREFLAAVKAARRKTGGADFMGSLSEFYGLRLVAERRGWNAAQITKLLPKLIRPAHWRQYESFIPRSADEGP